MTEDVTDDYYNFTTSTVETGPWMIVLVCTYSLLCIVLLPVLVSLGNKREKRINEQKRMELKHKDTFSTGSGSDDHVSGSSKDESNRNQDLQAPLKPETGSGTSGVLRNGNHTPKQSTPESRTVRFNAESDLGGQPRPRKYTASSALGSALSSAFSNVSAASYYSAMSSRSHRGSRRSRGRHVARLDMLALRQMENDAYDSRPSRPLGQNKNSMNYASNHYGNPTRRLRADLEHGGSSHVGSIVNDIDILPEHAADANDPGREKPFDDDDDNDEICSCKTFHRSLNVLVDVAHYDRETSRLMKLGIPFTLSGAIESIFDAIAVGLISKYLGINSLQAYVVTNLLIGLTETFVGGVSSSLETLCAHAIGCDNFFLAGQYVQIASVMYILVSFPLLGAWWFGMADCIRLFGMDEKVVEIGVKYTRIVIFDYMVDGVFGNFYTLLDINGQVTQATAFDVLTGLTDCLMTWFLLAFVEDIDLFWIGVSMLTMSSLHYFCFTLLAICKGWLDPFWDGMMKSFALKNAEAVKNVITTAIPLSFGYMLEYGEWEALTFFAAALGPAEVAAWGILESIWDLFEASTYGIASAGSIQLALHLGNGDIEGSKRCVGKTLFISSVFSIVITGIYFMVGEEFPALFTDNETLRHILNTTIPIVGIGKICMNFGMISWSLVGAQGRYRLATTISAIMSFFVTIPLAALTCIYMRLTLDGLVGSIIIGYSTTGLVLSYALLRSDWEHISDTIQETNKAEMEEYSESSSSEEEEE